MFTIPLPLCLPPTATQVTGAELDFVQGRAASSAGCRGARMVGAGFGGCVLALFDTAADAHACLDAIAEPYCARFGIRPSLFISSAGCGARVLKQAE